MSEISRIACDHCGKETTQFGRDCGWISFEPSYQHYVKIWLTVAVVYEPFRRPVTQLVQKTRLDFCSSDCLVGFLEQQALEKEKELIAEGYEIIEVEDDG